MPISNDTTLPAGLAERFWSKVDRSGECWLWLASKTPLGYGHFNIGALGGKKQYVGAHRLSWLLTYGSLPEHGEVLDHLCRTPSCVNPAHLEPVSQRDNVLRGASPKAVAFRNGTCVKGHDSSQFYRRSATGASVCCRACAAEKARIRRAERRA